MSSSGWLFFRGKCSQAVRNEGFTGRSIASELGDRWRKLSPAEKRNYSLQAFVAQSLEQSPEKLDRTNSVIKCHNNVNPAEKYKRRFSF